MYDDLENDPIPQTDHHPNIHRIDSSKTQPKIINHDLFDDVLQPTPQIQPQSRQNSYSNYKKYEKSTSNSYNDYSNNSNNNFPTVRSMNAVHVFLSSISKVRNQIFYSYIQKRIFTFYLPITKRFSPKFSSL